MPPDVASLFPPIEDELGPVLAKLDGEVLNAGAGSRDISGLVPGRLHNQDLIAHGDHIDVVSPLHEIPKDDGFFDAIVCNAVLEHVANPDAVVDEFARVLKPGGTLVLCVPFLQPEHLDPTDYQRYTVDGLSRLVEERGFTVRERDNVHNVYVTLGWILREWLTSVDDRKHRTLARFILPWVWKRARTSQHRVHSLASAYRVVAERDVV